MELRHLEHFLAVAEELSFTRAANRVHIVQSALSASVRTLERELGARLIERSTHHVELTDAGQALVAEARRTLLAVEAARDAVAATVGGIRGTLRLGIMHSPALVDLAELLTRYHQERPGVRIEPKSANSGGSAELAEAVRGGRLDLSFAAIPGGYPAGIEERPLVSEPLSLACPPGHPLASRRRIKLAELASERFVDFPVGWGTRLSVDQLFAKHGLDREVRVEIADIVVVSELVRAGFGLAFLSQSLLGTVRDLRLIPVVPSPRFVVSLIRSADRPLSAAARAFWELTTDRYPGT